MTIDELQALVNKMTPGEWTNEYAEHEVDAGKYGMTLCRCERKEDAAAIVALRNAAPALLECARLLIESVPADNASADYDDRVAAALKRLEESTP